jgi:hypothetical protein
MPHRSHRTRLVIAAAFVLAAAGCGGGAATGDVDKIQVTLGQFDVTVANTAGRALFEVRTEIMPAGPASHFTTTIARMESGEKRSLVHTHFTDRDGVPFSPRNVRVSGVLVTAKDIDGKALRVEVPWKQ